jgi:hypothetical protein
MIYRTNDGETIQASTPLRLVEKLKELSRDPEPSLYAFMEALADRVKQQTGQTIPVQPEAAFIAGLIEAGLITQEDDR